MVVELRACPPAVAGAAAVLRAEGLDEVTLRRLAQELSGYDADTDEPHAAVLNELWGGVAPPREGGSDEEVDTLLGSSVGVLFAHPGLARSALVDAAPAARWDT
ncbi:hypothetical protein [Pseudonocardia pini]|uniref:hypothetical protein n=1 Tax=Pseudonocardia pini TaxID=2758030 RepID=UPI0015F06548|nr:hypothetical protein [Pseudonocardia pini]